MLTLVAAALLTGCSGAGLGGSSTNATATPTGGDEYQQVHFYYDFEDILIPQELELDRDSSYVLETQQFKTGILVFNGSVDHISLVDFFITNMAKDNWRKYSSLKAEKSILTFEKPNKSCIITVYDESFTNTRVDIHVVESRLGSGESAPPQENLGPQPFMEEPLPQ
jgi:hypothetical protein